MSQNEISGHFYGVPFKCNAYKNEIPVCLLRRPESHFLFMRMTGLEPARTRHQILKLQSA